MPNIFTKETSYRVKHYYLEEWVAQILGLNIFNIWEINNDTSYRIEIKPLTEEEKIIEISYLKNNIEEILKQKGCMSWDLNYLFVYLYCKNFLDAGTYYIWVSW